MDNSQQSRKLQFLSGGGEMGRLTREKDWSKTAVGNPEQWPQSLRTTLSIILNSKFPMFLFWGPELICFYNDAYRPSLGNEGKHPNILGGRAEDFWKEIWKDIKPIIDHVLAGGEANWSEDQLLPIYRNGKMEDVYWTFSYSPVNDESGKPAGVFVTCTETTDKVVTVKKLEESNQRYLNNIIQAPVAMCILRGKNHVVEIANEMMLEIWGKLAGQVLNKPLFEGLPEAKGQGLEPLLDEVFTTGIKFIASERPVNLPRGNKVETTYINFIYEALRETDGTISGIVAIASEVTLQVKAREKIEVSEQVLQNMVLQAPIGICILDASTLVSEIVNGSFIEVAGKPYEAIIGKNYWEPFAEARPYYESALNDVVENGEPFYANEVKLMLVRHGTEEDIYVTFVYAPLKNDEGKVQKVAIWVLENTQQVVARQKIEEGTEKLNIVIEASDLGTWELDLESREPLYSKRYLQILGGYSEDVKLTHAELLSHLHPDDLHIREKAFKEALSTGYLQYEARVVWKDKSIHWIEGRGKVFYNDENKPIRLMGTVDDITKEKIREQELLESETRFKTLSDSLEKEVQERTRELKRSNESLIKSEERYHMMVDEVQDYAILYLSREGIVENWNKGAEKIKGYRANEIIGKSFSVFYTENDRKNNLPQHLLTQAAQTGKALQEGWRVRKDGSLFWASVVITAVHNEAGNVIGFSKVTHDLTEKKKASDELKRSEERYHMMVEEIQDYAILYLSREGIVENWNKGAEKIKGYSSSDIVGKSFSTFYTEEDRKINLPQQLLAKATQTGRASQEGWRVRKDGSHFWASVVITAVHNEAGQVIGFSKVTHDLTEKKKASDELKRNARELREKNSALEKMNEELESFAYISSHDLQEPLRKIQTFSSQILSSEIQQLSDNGKDKFLRMQNAAKRMQRLIEDLLAYSRTNSAERNFEKVDLNKIIEEVKEEMKEELLQKHATIEASGTCDVSIIPFQFRQLLVNLISNSLKFSDSKRAPHIKITSETGPGDSFEHEGLSKKKNYCHIRVADNGIGFEQKYSRKIFEVFQRLHGKNDYSGTGIGLAIVKKIIENHNGVIAAHGQVDQGATFDMYIPAVKDNAR